MRIAIILLFSVLSSPMVQARVIEDTNRTGITHLYVFENDVVKLQRCDAAPQLDIENAGCIDVKGVVVSVAQFHENFGRKMKVIADQASLELNELSKKYVIFLEQRTALGIKISSMAMQTPQPLGLDDFKMHLSEFDKTLAALQEKILLTRKIISASNLIFGDTGILKSKVVYPISKMDLKFSFLRLYVREIYASIMMSLGQLYGPNTWFDVESGHVWYSTMKISTWPVAFNATPKDYEQPNPKKSYASVKSVSRFRSAVIAGETNLPADASCLGSFWGSSKQDNEMLNSPMKPMYYDLVNGDFVQSIDSPDRSMYLQRCQVYVSQRPFR